MRLVRFSTCVINLDAVTIINLYPDRAIPMIQVCFAADDFVNLESPEDVAKMKQIIQVAADVESQRCVTQIITGEAK